MAKIATREAYGKALAELVSENENIVVLDADLSGSTKSGMAKKVAPERHCNMGIAEGNMMSVAAGLAAAATRYLPAALRCLRSAGLMNKSATASVIRS